MHTSRFRHRFTAVLGALIVLSLLIVPASANHQWGSYHFKRTANPFTIPVGNSLSGGWSNYLGTSIGEWNASLIVNLESNGSVPRTDPKKCRPSAGAIQVCNTTYGRNGWLGLAQIWISGGHITQGTAKLNDSYFNTTTYNTPAWRGLVMCQEIAHTFGLDHQDENHSNANLLDPEGKGSCMDYTNAPANATSPNAYDMEQLRAMYDPTYTVTDAKAGTHVSENWVRGHLETAPATTTSTTGQTQSEDEVTSNDPRAWGRAIEHDDQGRPTLFERDFGADLKVFTFVIPVERGPVAPTANDGGGDGTGDGTGDGGRNDGGRDGGRDGGGKRDGAKNDGGRDGGGKRDGAKQRQGHDHDRHNH